MVDGLSAVFTPDGGIFGHPGVPGWVSYYRDQPAGTGFTPGEDADTPPPSIDLVAPVRLGDDHLS
jgi:hypothetical protein